MHFCRSVSTPCFSAAIIYVPVFRNRDLSSKGLVGAITLRRLLCVDFKSGRFRRRALPLIIWSHKESWKKLGENSISYQKFDAKT